MLAMLKQWLNNGPLYDVAVAASIVHALGVTVAMIFKFHHWDQGTMATAWGAVTTTMGAHWAGDRFGKSNGS